MYTTRNRAFVLMIFFFVLGCIFNSVQANNETLKNDLCSHEWYRNIEIDGSKEFVKFNRDGTFCVTRNDNDNYSYTYDGTYTMDNQEIVMYFNKNKYHALQDYNIKLKYINSMIIPDLYSVLWELMDSLEWGEYILYESEYISTDDEISDEPYYLLRSKGLTPNTENIAVYLNNQELKFDQPPIMDPAGRVLVPIRQIAESMGDNVMWNQPLQTAFVHHKERALIIPLNLNYLYIATSDKPSQWQQYDLDVPSQVINGRTLTPLRAFCEGLGADVEWEGNTRTVYITYNTDYEYDVLPEQQIDGINIAYGLIRNNPNLSFDKYSNEIIDYFDNSNHGLNNAAMAWGDSLLSGIVQLLSGEDATESAVKERLAYIVSMLAEMDTKNGNYEFVDNIMFNKSGMEALQKFVSLPEENVKITSIKDLENLSETVPELENLSNAIDATGLAVDILAFSAEESIYLLADYTQNIAYLDNIEKYLRGTATGDDIIYNSIDKLKKEYSEKWLHTVKEIRKDGTDKVISAMLDKGTSGVFSIVNFAKDLTNKITGLSASAEGLREFYAVCILNVAFDEAYSKMANRVFERPFYADDMIDMFNIQKATKISTYESMNKIANAVEEISYDNQIAELNNKSYILW